MAGVLAGVLGGKAHGLGSKKSRYDTLGGCAHAAGDDCGCVSAEFCGGAYLWWVAEALRVKEAPRVKEALRVAPVGMLGRVNDELRCTTRPAASEERPAR